MDTSGFYKQGEEGEWYYAPNFVYSRDYELERDGNRVPIDGWQWYDTAPIEYTKWYEANFPINNELI